MSLPHEQESASQPNQAYSASRHAVQGAGENVHEAREAVGRAAASISNLVSGQGNMVDAAVAVRGAYDNVRGLTGRLSATAMMPVMQALSAFKGQAILPAGKQMDPVMGIDVHMVTIPPSPAPVPMPHPYIGILFNPKDWVSCLINTFRQDVLSAIPEPAEGDNSNMASIARNREFITGVAMGLAGMSASVKFGGFVPRAVTGTKVKNIPHIPMGAGFHPAFAAAVAKNNGKAFLGSLFVAADGDPMVGSFHLNYDCWDMGIVDLFKSRRAGAMKAPEPGEPMAELFVPSGTVLPIPWGRPVLVNSIPTPINPMAILDRLFRAGLGRLRAAARRGVERGLTALRGRVGCGTLTAVSRAIGTGQSHPVDVAGGYFYTDNEDFKLPGPIALVWERIWYSNSNYNGPLGHGWHHRYDMALALDQETGRAVVRLGDGRPALFEMPAADKPSYNRGEKMFLHLHGEGYYYTTDNKGLIHRFTQKEYANPYTHTRTYLLQSVANRNGFAIRLTYDGNGFLKQITDSAGRVLVVKNDERGRIVSIHAPDPRFGGRTDFIISDYNYSEEGDMEKQTDALHASIKYEYKNHLLVKEIWRNGFTWNFRYDKAMGTDAKCVEAWGEENLLHYTFDYTDPLCTLVTNSLGYKKLFYHKNGIVTKHIDANGGKWEYRYNQYNELEWEVDPLGNATAYTYDDWGNMVARVDPDGTFLQTVYMHPHYPWLPTQAVDTAGGRWTYEYDDAGNLVQNKNPAGVCTYFGFEDGLFKSVKDNIGINLEISYDNHFNQKKIVKQNGSTTLYEYDFLGNCIRITNPNSKALKQDYDLKARVTQLVDFDGNTMHFTYDALDNIVLYRDDHKEVQYSYSGTWSLASRTEAGATIRFVNDTEERLCCVVNEQSLRYSFEYDGAGNIIKETGFDGITRTYERNKAGWMTKINRPGSKHTYYEYDEAGRIVKIKYHDESSREFTYSKGLLTAATCADAVIAFEHDDMGNVIRESCNGNSITNRFDQLSRRTGMSSSLGAEVSYEFDLSNNTRQIQTDGWNMTMEYDKLGLEVSRSLTGGITSQWQRDATGRARTHRIQKSGTTPSLLFHCEYGWNKIDQLGKLIDARTGITEFAYNSSGSLAKTKFDDGREQLRNPDAVGNLFETHERTDRKYDKGSRLLRSKRATYVYDEEGFLIEKRGLDNRTWKYEWNAAGWLVKVIRPDAGIVFFKYDAIGRRIEKTYKKTVTKWFWDGNKPLHEWKEFDTKESSADDLITWIFEESTFAPAAKIKGEKKYSIISDHLGTPLQGYNREGELIWSRKLDSYGKIRMLQGEEGFCNYLYPGQIMDQESELVYNRFRYYSADEGMYISQDPLGLNSGQINLYAYVKDPNGWVDVFGLVSGGSYYEVRSTSTGGEVHHMPANSVNQATGSAGHGSAPAIHMSTTDHAQTSSHGSQGANGAAYRAQQEAHIRNGRYDLAMGMDVRDVSRRFPGRYTDSMRLAIQYARDRVPPLITAQQARNLLRQCR